MGFDVGIGFQARCRCADTLGAWIPGPFRTRFCFIAMSNVDLIVMLQDVLSGYFIEPHLIRVIYSYFNFRD